MANIFIASKQVNAPKTEIHIGEHTYWVFDPDGNPNSGDEKVIRGGDNDADGRYTIEIDRDLADSRDYLNGDHVFDDTGKINLAIAEQTAFASAIALWDSFSAFSITSTTGKGDINVYNADLIGVNGGVEASLATETATTTAPLSADYARSEIVIDSSETISSSGFGLYLALHEMGHALGLSHPNNNPFDSNYDSMKTVMSVNYPGAAGATVTVNHWAITPMAYDIAALEKQYGTFIHNDGNNENVRSRL